MCVCVCVLLGAQGRRCVTWVGVHCRRGGVCVWVCVCCVVYKEEGVLPG